MPSKTPCPAHIILAVMLDVPRFMISIVTRTGNPGRRGEDSETVRARPRTARFAPSVSSRMGYCFPIWINCLPSRANRCLFHFGMVLIVDTIPVLCDAFKRQSSFEPLLQVAVPCRTGFGRKLQSFQVQASLRTRFSQKYETIHDKLDLPLREVETQAKADDILLPDSSEQSKEKVARASACTSLFFRKLVAFCLEMKGLCSVEF